MPSAFFLSSERRPPYRNRSSRRSGCRRDPGRRRFRPGFDPLQDRTLLSTFTVLNLDDAGPGSLRSAIGVANANAGPDTIDFDAGVAGTIVLESTLVVTDDLTIDGPGALALTVSGDDAVRPFAVMPAGLAADPFVTPTAAQLADAPEVAIAGLTIADGLATDALGFDPASGFAFGGGLYNYGGAVHLDGVHLSGNMAAGALAAGGGVANEFGGSLTVTGGRFEGNLADGLVVGAGGAITSDIGPTTDGAGTTSGQPEVSVDASTFLGNAARSLIGYDDAAPFSGLAIGGAILNLAGSLTITGSDFEGNAAEGGTGAANAAAAEAGGTAYGGAVNSGNVSPFGIQPSTLAISDSTFTANTATAGPGGAAGIPGGEAAGGAVFVPNAGAASLVGNAFGGNAAIGGAGGDDASGGLATGGAVAGAGGASLTLEGNTLAENTADGGPGSGAGPAAIGRGGGLGLIAVTRVDLIPGPATASSTGDTYSGNAALGGIGGGIYNEGELILVDATVEANAAVGDPAAVAVTGPALAAAGGAVGGGLANSGTLDLRGSRFLGNAAEAADDAEGPFAGGAFGGALSNDTTDFGTATAAIADTIFDDNQALAGDRGDGDFAAIAGGGAITNDSTMTIDRSTFRRNRAVAGDDATSPFHNGHALGGAISTGSLSPSAVPSFPGGDLIVRRGTFLDNEAIGGDRNVIALPGIPPADTPNNGYGGAILAYQGSVEVLDSTIGGNRAVGGVSAIDQGGSLGVGGGLFLFNFLSLTASSGLRATVRGGTIAGNAAIGGDGPVGGDGIGGGIAIGTFGSLFAPGEGAHAAIDRTLIVNNRAEGGNGGDGPGGDGRGGGIANLAGTTTTVANARLLLNRAVGGDGLTGGDGKGGGIASDEDAAMRLLRSALLFNLAAGGSGTAGPDGLGIGGGIFDASGGLFAIDFFSRFLTRFNYASTADDDIHGDLD